MAEADDFDLEAIVEKIVDLLNGDANNHEFSLLWCQLESKCLTQQAMMKVLCHFSFERLLQLAFTQSTFDQHTTYLQALGFAIEVKDYARLISRLPDIWPQMMLLLNNTAYPGTILKLNERVEKVRVAKNLAIKSSVSQLFVRILANLPKEEVDNALESGIFETLLQSAESDPDYWRFAFPAVVTSVLHLSNREGCFEKVWNFIDGFGLNDRDDILDENTLFRLNETPEARRYWVDAIKDYKKNNPILRTEEVICANCGKHGKKMKKHWKQHKKVCLTIKSVKNAS